ncbi:hypothetical protein L2U69_16725 [Zavarzinia compransoris]|uniref:hypothetical protein n=1 Tax=Zavarzinia marina TaxID=2911065 RepID=UPI001F1D4B24|nr:hypothetical protein [Zavarzinia marina]MCF4167295.1 hypothetical protein [Zavarzinia marina]
MPAESAGGVLRQVAMADLVILAPFAVPFLAERYLALWFWLNGRIGHDAVVPDLGATGWLLVNLMGFFAVWAAVLRLRARGAVAVRLTLAAKAVAVVLIAIGLVRGAAPILAVALVADAVACLRIGLAGRQP